MMALDESFKRPGTIPFKWEVQPGIPKADDAPPDAAAASSTPPLPPATPSARLAPPPAARASSALASASCRRTTSVAPAPPSHRRSMSARFATSLALPFTRRTRRGRPNDDVDFCLLYSEEIA